MVDHTAFLAIAEEAVAHLQRIKQDFPRLISPNVVNALENWSRLERDLRSAGGGAKDLQALEATALELIGNYQLEDVLDLLNEKFDTDYDYAGLINLVGEDRYRLALQSEAAEMQRNAVSYEQMADFWNAMGKPALGEERWTSQAVSALCVEICYQSRVR